MPFYHLFVYFFYTPVKFHYQVNDLASNVFEGGGERERERDRDRERQRETETETETENFLIAMPENETATCAWHQA